MSDDHGGARRPRAEPVRDPRGPGPGARARTRSWPGSGRSRSAAPTPTSIRGDYPGFWPPAFPFIPGHEWAGEIVALGPGAERYGWTVGDRVAGTSPRRLRRLPEVRRGPLQPVRELRQAGPPQAVRPQRPGRRRDVRRPGRQDDLPAARRPLASTRAPSSTRPRSPSTSPTAARSPRATRSPSPAPARSACLGGDAARIRGAARVILIERNPGRLAKAAAMGFETVDAAAGDPVAIVREHDRRPRRRRRPRVRRRARSPSSGPSACSAAAAAARRSASRPSGVEIAMQRLVLDELELVGCRASAGEMRRVMPLVEQGRMRVREVMTHRFALADYDAGARHVQRPRERGHQDHRRALSGRPRAPARPVAGRPGEPLRDLRLRLRPAPRPALRRGQARSSAARPPTSPSWPATSACRCRRRSRSRPRPATSTSPTAGRTASTTSCASTWPGWSASSAAASATRPTRSWSASAPGPRSRCPG